jgi:hypothetical protein
MARPLERTEPQPEVPAGSPAADEPSAGAPLDLEAWMADAVAPTAVHELLIDAEGTVLQVGPDPSDVLGLDLSGLVGRSVVELIDAFVPRFGELHERAEQPLPEGAPPTARVERVSFGSDGGSTDLLVVMEAGATTGPGTMGMRVLLGLDGLEPAHDESR